MSHPHPVELLQELPRSGPVALFSGAGWGRTLLCRDPVATLTIAPGDHDGAFRRLGEFLGRHADRLCSGWLGHDLGLDVEAWPLRLPFVGPDELPAPVLHLVAWGRIDATAPSPPPPAPPVPAATALRAHTDRADYERRVAAVVEHIRAGDLFQANLTQPFTAAWSGDPRRLFWRLCRESEAPFAAYLEDGAGTAVLGSSPEELLWRDGDQLRTRPIKGTRPRAVAAAADRALLDELLHSDKDLAELAMIVDLLRNDFGKVAATGSVAVGPFPEHASFAQVHHLFATVTARLRRDVDTVDLLRAVLPFGSVTGCPKLRCLEVLEQLELVRRGVYTGAVGTFGPGPRCHLNVAIRTMVAHGDRVRANAGGGITALSDPAAEYDETLHKLAGIERALQCRAAAPEAR
ncbi:MAG: anthranilate synthase component I family protein [Planctomycetota bacterium]